MVIHAIAAGAMITRAIAAGVMIIRAIAVGAIRVWPRRRETADHIALAPLRLDPNGEQPAQLGDQHAHRGRLRPMMPIIAIEVTEEGLMGDQLTRRPSQAFQGLPLHRSEPDRRAVELDAVFVPIDQEAVPGCAL